MFKLLITTFLMSLISCNAFACKQSAVLTSKKMIEFILADLIKTYKHDSGGGIKDITQLATSVYKISLLQEERIDEITYHLLIKPNCSIAIESKTNSTKAVGPQNSESK